MTRLLITGGLDSLGLRLLKELRQILALRYVPRFVLDSRYLVSAPIKCRISVRPPLGQQHLMGLKSLFIRLRACI